MDSADLVGRNSMTIELREAEVLIAEGMTAVDLEVVQRVWAGQYLLSEINKEMVIPEIIMEIL